MLTTHQNSNNPFFKILFIAAALAVVIVFCIANSGCTSKHITKTRDTSSQVVKTDSTEHYRQLANSLQLKAEEEKEDLNARLAFEQHDMDALLYEFNELQQLYTEKDLSFDSLNKRLRKIFDSVANTPCKTILKVDSKGAIEATGIKSFDLEAVINRTRIEILRDSLRTEHDMRLKAEKQTTHTTEASTVIKKRGFPWFWFIVGMLLGMAIMILIAYLWAKYDDDLKKSINNN